MRRLADHHAIQGGYTMVFDALEPRVLLSTVLAGGLLQITEAEGADRVLVAESGGILRVDCNGMISFWDRAQVSSIAAYVGGGDDSVNLAGVALPCVVDGGAGNDSITGGSAADILRGGEGDDVVQGGNGDDQLYGNGGNDILRGALGNDMLRGAAGSDWLYGGQGADLLTGGADSDTMDGAAGPDTMQGGEGVDLADYSLRTEDLLFALNERADDGAVGEGDNIQGDVENIVAGSGNDRFWGNDAANTFWCGAGNDTVDGGWGNDTLWGGEGFDTGDYSSRTMLQQLRINEGTGVPGEQDIPHDDIECLIGGAGDDWIQGADNDNLLIGNGGDDTLIGFGGNDTLIGGAGADMLGHDFSGPRPDLADAGDDVMYTNEIGDVDDGAVDRIADEAGVNLLSCSVEDGDLLLTNWPPPDTVPAGDGANALLR